MSQENPRKLPDIITVFAEMSPLTLFTPEWMAKTMGRHVYSIDRAIERGDFPSSVGFPEYPCLDAGGSDPTHQRDHCPPDGGSLEQTQKRHLSFETEGLITMPGVRQKPNTPKGNYQGWYYVDRARKERKFFTGSKDRQATFVDAWEREKAALRGYGRHPIDHLTRPIQEVVEEYLAWGASQGGKRHKPWAPEHRRKQAFHLAWWRDTLRLSALGDLDGCLGRVEHALRALEAQGASGKTRANYAGALQGFCSWALKRRYLAEHPLQEFVLPDTTRQTTWRDFTAAEIQRLLDHCAPHRRLLYEVTLFSGLRRNELRQLALEHLDLEHSGLRLGTFTKNRQALFHPLPRDLAERLHAHAVSGEPNRVYMSRTRDEVPRDVPLSPLLYVPVGTARDLAQDLAAAGILLVTEHGKAVFHSLRITYINLVLDLGVNPKEAQQLARHSTVNLTMNVYGRTRSEFLSGVVDRCC